MCCRCNRMPVSMKQLAFCVLTLWCLVGNSASEKGGCKDPGSPVNGYRVGEDFRVYATVEYFCNPGFKFLSGSRIRTCGTNKLWSGALPVCTDINECLEYEDASVFDIPKGTYPGIRLCHTKAVCVNTVGSFVCKCKTGYVGDGQICAFVSSIMTNALLRRNATVPKHGCGTLGSYGNSSRVRRIVGGKLSTQGAWPWQAAISFKNNGRSYLFNGALIKPRWILTVANQLRQRGREGKPVKSQHLRVLLGDYDRSKKDNSEQAISVKRIISHPRYNRNTLAHNIALLELNQPVKTSNSIRTVCLSKRQRDSDLEEPPHYGTVSGWGSIRRITIGEKPGQLSRRLREVTVPLMSDEQCKKSSFYTYNPKYTLCAGFKVKPGSPCFGDVGSPLVIHSPLKKRWLVIGLFGWSLGCGQPKKYAYYTRVSKYRKWIYSVINKRN